MNYYFTSDTHFGHANILKYCNRPFSSIREMDEIILQNINKMVRPEDVLFHLGDFSMGEVGRHRYKINCRNIHLILGNHDKLKPYERREFCSVSDMKTVKLQYEASPLGIVLCHYAMRVWNKSHHGYIHLYGHSHSTLPDDPFVRSMDVGVDSVAKIYAENGIREPKNYRPLNLDEIMAFMTKKQWKPIDHHGE